MTFMENAVQYWRIVHRSPEPDTVDFLGSFPDETPKHYVYQITWGESITYIIVSVEENMLGIREADEKEVEALETIGTDTSEDDQREEASS